MSERYERQIALPEIGAAGQARLAAARVLVVGAGGLGCIVLQYLAAAGYGELHVVDPDCVQESNLHRQPLYRTADVGALKVEAAKRALLQLNPSLQMTAAAQRLTPANAPTLIDRASLVIDAADNFATTYTLSDACFAARKPLISASVAGWRGYVGGFCGGGPSYRAVFPQLPTRSGNCNDVGVLGTSVAVLGALQAHLALLHLLEQPTSMGRCLTVDLRTLRIGSFDFFQASEPEDRLPFIAASQVTTSDVLVDLRRGAEARLELDALLEHNPAERESRIVLCCTTGLRAWHAARQLQQHGYTQLALLAAEV